MGEHIRRRRPMLSITQEEAAAHLGVNAWVVPNWEIGETKQAIQSSRPSSGSSAMTLTIDQGALAGRLIAKRRELGLFQREAARCFAIDPGTWAGW